MPDPQDFESRLADAFIRYTRRAPADVDALALAREVAEASAAEAQRRTRWWPFRRPDREVPNRVTGRTQSMISPAKAITAGALVFAIGGMLLIAQPFDQQRGGVPGAGVSDEAMSTAAQSDDRWPNPESATMFTGRIADGPKILEGITDEDGLYLGGLEEASWVEISDSRLDGSITIATSATGDGLGPTADSDVINNAYRITTDGGEWIGQPSPWFWLEDDTISNRVHVLSGHGDYEGWTALMELSGDLSWSGPIDVVGIIYEGELPVPPPFSMADR